MPEVEKARIAERAEEADFDVKSTFYTESFVKLVAVGAEIGNDAGDRDTWSDVDNDEDLEARAAGKDVLRDNAFLAKNANEVSYDAVSEWTRKVAGKLSIGMDQRTARGPNEDGEEITGESGEDESFIAFNAYMSWYSA